VTPKQSLHLPLTDGTDADIAARFIAELVRQGVTFKARRDIGPHPSGLRSEPVITIEFTGGF
jgi:hypothetical protein